MMASASGLRDTRVDDLDRLVERSLESSVNGRHALAATLYTRAENLAIQLHPDDTCLVPAWLRYKRGAAILRQASLVKKAEGTQREDAGKHAQAWELLQGVTAVIERRAAAGTTNYGTCRQEEVSLYGRWIVAVQRATNLPQATTQQLEALSPAVGYVLTSMVAANALFELSYPVPLAANERQHLEAFVLSTVDSMRDIARAFPRYSFAEEKLWVSVIEMVCAQRPRSDFVTALHVRWTAAPFQAMLRARGFSDAQATMNKLTEQSTVRRDADIAAHGLHPCGLPSCDQREVSVKQFKYCGDCEAEWYCCAEHQVLHWQEHKPICQARTAAAAAAATVE